jgi:hypothetical protein
LLSESGKLHSCFTRHFFRYAMARQEVDAQDGCLLETARKGLTGTGGGLQALIKVLPTAAEFKLRKYAY